MDSMQPTPARDWGKPQAYELPNGHIALLKRPSILTIVAAGGDNPISNAALLKVRGGRDTTPPPITDEERLANLRDNAKVYLEVIAQAMVAPRLVLDRDPNPDANEIGPADLDDSTMLWLYWSYVMGAAKDVESFRVTAWAGAR